MMFTTRPSRMYRNSKCNLTGGHSWNFYKESTSKMCDKCGRVKLYRSERGYEQASRNK